LRPRSIDILPKAGHTAGVEVFLLLMGMWFMVAMALGLRKARPDVSAARGVRARIDAVYSQPHEFVKVEPAAFPQADMAFYDRARIEMQGLGYRFVADVEDVTMTEAYPASRTFMRLMSDSGGLVRAALYHVQPRGMVISILQLVQVVPRHLRVVELVTEIDGVFLATANTQNLDRLEPPIEVRTERLPMATSVAKLVAHHQSRIADYLNSNPHQLPRSVVDYDEIMASIARSQVAMARHRQKVGGLTRDELERIKGRPLTAYEEQFLHEIQSTPSEAGKSVTSKPKPTDNSDDFN
jgi:hypothetical protein